MVVVEAALGAFVVVVGELLLSATAPSHIWLLLDSYQSLQLNKGSLSIQ